MGTVRGTRGRIKAAMRGMRTAMGVIKAAMGGMKIAIGMRIRPAQSWMNGG